MNEQEVIRIAVKASLAAMGAMLAAIMALFLMAAAVSPDINLPGVRQNVGNTVGSRGGD